MPRTVKAAAPPAPATKEAMVRLWAECFRTKVAGGGDIPAAVIAKSLCALDKIIGRD